jgi:predicted nucleic acid-binding protein
MAIVVDASVTIGWYLADEAAATAQTALHRLGETEALVPALWWFEVRNALLINERRGRINTTQTAEILADLGKLTIHLDREPDGHAIIGLARAHRLTFYDAAYLELARRLDAPLATLDRQLAAAARAAAVSLLGGDEP